MLKFLKINVQYCCNFNCHLKKFIASCFNCCNHTFKVVSIIFVLNCFIFINLILSSSFFAQFYTICNDNKIEIENCIHYHVKVINFPVNVLYEDWWKIPIVFLTLISNPYGSWNDTSSDMNCNQIRKIIIRICRL